MKKIILISIAALLVIAGIVCWFVLRDRQHPDDIINLDEIVQPNLLYGIEYYDTDLVLDEGIIQQGQTISTIFSGYGISMQMIDRTARTADEVFPLRNIRAGNKYTAFLTADSLEQLKYFVYEQNVTDYIVIAFHGDSVSVHKDHKDVTVERKIRSGEITSSLWNSMIEAGMTPAMSKELEDIYQWTIDFFALQPGDHYTLIYDERSVDSVQIGGGQIWGALFHHYGKDYYAIPFKQENNKIEYWDQDGNSLRKSILKAPLKYSRISSKFSNSRMHPILRIRRPHHGVDYAAPSGTPVQSVANGTVIFAGWGGGGGNTIKIQHSNNMVTGYLHLRGFAKGIRVGTRVSQGDLIGYVGSTGTSTGPHLDYRIWIKGKAIDPLKLTSEPGEPIWAKNKQAYDLIKERTLAELRGELPDSLKIRQLDSLYVYFPELGGQPRNGSAVSPAQAADTTKTATAN